MKQKNTLLTIFTLITFIVMMFSFISVAFADHSAIDLGTAGNYAIISKAGVSTTGLTSVIGNIAVSPVAASYITGFSLIADSSNQFSTSSLVTGSIFAANYAVPTPSVLTTAISDMETAYTDAAGRSLPNATELGAGDIGGMTLEPGLYTWSTGLIIPTDVTLNGSSSDVWIFQVAQTLDISSGKQVLLTGGALAENVFWQVGGQVTMATTSVMNGIILSQTAIVMNTGATLNGKALAQTAVTLDASTVTSSGGSPVLTTISLTPSYANLTNGSTIQLNITKVDQFGVAFVTGVTYNSSNVSVATVNASGFVTSLSAGNTTITSYNGSVSDTSLLIFELPVLTTITLSPASIHMNTGYSRTLTATLLDQYGVAFSATTLFNSSNTSVATVNNLTGSVTSIAPGNTVISSTNGSIFGSSIVTVEAVKKSGGGSGGSSSSSSGGVSSFLNNTRSSSFAVMAKDTYDLNFTNTALAITNLKFTTTKNAAGVKLVVTQLNAKPFGVETLQTLAVYSYFEIEHTNLNNSILDSVKISFKVPTSWIVDKNVAASQIKLYRWTTGWDVLKTTLVSSDNNYYYFEAISPGLSYFAIGAAEIEPVATNPSTTATVTPTQSVNSPAVVDKTTVISTSSVVKPAVVNSSTNSKWWLLAGILLVVGLITGGYFARNAYFRNQNKPLVRR